MSLLRGRRVLLARTLAVANDGVDERAADEDGRVAPPAIALPSRPESRAVERRRLLEEML